MSKEDAFTYELGRITFIESCWFAIFPKLFTRRVEMRWRMYQQYLEMNRKERKKLLDKMVQENQDMGLYD